MGVVHRRGEHEAQVGAGEASLASVDSPVSHSSTGFGSELYSIVDSESPLSRHDAQSGTTLSTTSGMAQKPESAARQGELHVSESETLCQQRDEMDLQALKCGAQLAVSVAASGAGDPAAPQLPK